MLTEPSIAPCASIMLPSMIYAVQGQEINMYWDGVINSLYNNESFLYDVLPNIVGADVSNHENYRWTFKPAVTNIGDSALTLCVYYGPNLLASKSVVLRVRPAQANPPVSRKVLAIGDSTTSGGIWLSELVNLGNQGGLTLIPVGTKSATYNDAGGTPRTTYHEAVSGKTIAWYYTDPTSPFVFGGKFDFAQYLAVNSISLGADDWVTVLLGVNDMFSWTSDIAAQQYIAMMKIQLGAMLANIQAAVPGIRIGLALTTPPAHNQDAFGYNYYSGQTQWRYKRNRDMWVSAMIDTWGTAYQNNKVWLIPTHMVLDTRNNMVTSGAYPNSRNTTAFTKQVNGLHPANSGYWQIADGFYTFYRGQES